MLTKHLEQATLHIQQNEKNNGNVHFAYNPNLVPDKHCLNPHINIITKKATLRYRFKLDKYRSIYGDALPQQGGAYSTGSVYNT